MPREATRRAYVCRCGLVVHGRKLRDGRVVPYDRAATPPGLPVLAFTCAPCLARVEVGP